MAKSKSFTVRKVKKNEERKRPGIFIRLKDTEKFVAHALFEPDAELEDNPGFYEHFSHYDASARTTVPCVGEDCIMCENGDTPSTRALTLWYLPDAPTAEQFKVFTASGMMVDDLADEAEELDGILGRKFRVKRRGTEQKTRYKITSLNEKLSKSEIKKLLKLALESIDLEAIIAKQAKVQYERLRAVEALEDDDDLEDVDDDDDDDEDTKSTKSSKSRKGKKVEDDDDDDDEDDEDDDDDDEDEETPDPIEDVEFELLSVSKKNNTAKVEHEKETIVIQGDDDDASFEEFKKGDTVVISAEVDEDGDWVASAVAEPGSDDDDDEDDDEDEDDDDDDAQSEIEGVLVTVQKVNEEEEILSVKDNDGDLGTFDLYLPEGIELDFDDFAKGTKLKVTAALDEEGDWVMTEEPEIQKKGKSSKSGKSKGKSKK